MEPHVFDVVGDGLVALLPDDLGPWGRRAHRYGIKLWFGGAAEPGREHYEAQVVGARHVPGATTLAIEVGFHAEHPDPARNEAAVAPLRAAAAERRWRQALGPEPVVGPFLGHDGGWLRVSETWPDPDLGDPELALALAARLTDYAVALEPLMRARTSGRRSGGTLVGG